jgi:Ca-activated chloride channel homolog
VWSTRRRTPACASLSRRASTHGHPKRTSFCFSESECGWRRPELERLDRIYLKLIETCRQILAAIIDQVMMFRVVTSLQVNLILCLFATWAQNSAPAQSNQPQSVTPKSPGSSVSTKPDESLLTLRTAVSEVHLVFTVTDKHGHYVNDLKESDFQILDDHKPPEAILSFRVETDLPLQVGLLIDTSQSVRERFKFEQEEAISFLHQTLRQKHDQAFVMGFDITPKVTQDFTDDIEKVSAGIHMLQPGSLTALYDAVYYACRDKLMKQPQSGPARRIIILLSDGDDNTSSITMVKAIEIAKQAEVSVYTISTSLTRSGGLGQKNLESIAEATGGRSYVPVQLTGVTNAFAAIQEELRSQYAVSYKPAAFKLDGHYRTIEIQAQKQKGLRIRSRKGYRSVQRDYTSKQ